jgi:hypothetical protein
MMNGKLAVISPGKIRPIKDMSSQGIVNVGYL